MGACFCEALVWPFSQYYLSVCSGSAPDAPGGAGRRYEWRLPARRFLPAYAPRHLLRGVRLLWWRRQLRDPHAQPVYCRTEGNREQRLREDVALMFISALVMEDDVPHPSGTRLGHDLVEVSQGRANIAH